MEELKFTIPEILSFVGAMQCIYVLIYMFFRAGDRRRAFLPFAYFWVLAIAFGLDFSARFIAGSIEIYPIYQWFFWFSGLPLSVLLVLQIARIKSTPEIEHYWVLLLTPIAFICAVLLAGGDPECQIDFPCDSFLQWLVVTGILAGVISMVAIWGQRDLLANLYKEKAGKDRYWLILMLIIVNLFFLSLMLFSLSSSFSYSYIVLGRNGLGLLLVYLVGISLFKIYPQAVPMLGVGNEREGLSEAEYDLAKKIEQLLDYDKIYQEPTYGRSDLAKELNIPEASLSKIINLHFGKALPRIFNERRVEDAKRLLRETDAPIKIITEEVGFNSAASFNRVFMEIVGVSPTDYRKSG